MPPPSYTYSPMHQCAWPPLAKKVLPLDSDQTFLCDTCGRLWVAANTVASGGKALVQWVYPLPSTSQLAALTARLAALEARTATVLTDEHRAVVQVTALLVGGKVDLPVTWPAPFADTAYAVETLVPAALLGKITVTVKAGTQTKAGVTLTVTASAAIIAGSALDVTARRYLTATA